MAFEGDVQAALAEEGISQAKGSGKQGCLELTEAN